MRPDQRRGYLLAIAAYVIWGLFPVYWKQLAGVDALEVLAHRTGWSVVFAGVLLLIVRQGRAALAVLANPQDRWRLTLSALAIAFNWGVYIWAVANEQVVAASMGYYLSPLLSVLAGAMFFSERLRYGQWLAVALAAAGVLNQMISLGEVPWVGLSVGFSFAIYGAIRKSCHCDSLTGLFAETLLLAPLAFGWMIWLAHQGEAAFLNQGMMTDSLLLLAGAVTATPLLLYVGGARRLPLATMGLLFYLTPSIQFSIGVLQYGESVSLPLMITFMLIWAALVLYTLEGRMHARRQARLEPGL